MNALVFGPELASVRVVDLPAPVPEAEVTFHPEPAWVKIALPSARGGNHGMLSGAEGQGSELVFMEDGALGEMVLEFKPPEVVEVMEPALSVAVRSAIDSQATPARVFLATWKTAPLVPDLVALSSALDLAVLSFCGWTERGRQTWREELQELRLVQIARNITLGLSREGGHLAWIAVTDFARRQRVRSVLIDEFPHSGTALAALNELHRCYYSHPPVTELERVCAATRGRMATSVPSDPDYLKALDRVAEVHLADLRRRERHA